MNNPRRHEPTHTALSARLVIESLLVYATLAAAAAAVLVRSELPWRFAALAVLVAAEGIWLDRMYVVAHEAVHRKLFPGMPRLNDLAARVLLAPIGAPLAIYRKIHFFHHGSNRKDPLTAALDSFVSTAPLTNRRRLYYRLAWLFYVYCGGFFLHSLISILLFLAAPISWSRTLSPVFNGWRMRMRIVAWCELAAGIALHAAVWVFLGFDIWCVTLGLPLAVFAWVWSLLLYIYHYDTTIGPDVRHNVRSLRYHPFFSWLLLNFNEHATHHHDPSIPWHELPARRHALPAEFEANQNVTSIWAAIWQQRKGPLMWEHPAADATHRPLEREAR